MIGREQVLHVQGPVRWAQVGGPSVDPPHLEALVRSPHAGAVVVFLGTTRDDCGPDGTIEALDYEAAHPLADQEMMRIAQEAAHQFRLTAIKTRVPIWKRNILDGPHSGSWVPGTPIRIAP